MFSIPPTLLGWLKFWEWPGRIVKLVDQWNAMRESAHRARKAKAEADVAVAGKTEALYEIKVQEMMRRFRGHYSRVAAEHPGEYVVPIIKPSPEDDLEVFNEAMRRVKKENGPSR